MVPQILGPTGWVVAQRTGTLQGRSGVSGCLPTLPLPGYRGQPPHLAGPLVAGLDKELVLGRRVVQAGGELWRVIEVSHGHHAAVRGPRGGRSFARLPGQELVRRLRPGRGKHTDLQGTRSRQAEHQPPDKTANSTATTSASPFIMLVSGLGV